MIGQRYLLERINGQVERGRFPRFAIFIGERGSGKKCLASTIADYLKYPISFVDIKVDSIREVIDTAYKVDTPIIYVIADCDNMSSAAANALLKVTEEPPKNAYFILTCENEENLLQTIRSRGVTYMLEPYSYEDKCDYIEEQGVPEFEEDENFILEVASNCGEVQQMLNMDVHQFKTYVDLVIDNIAEVSGSNAFKIGDKIALKDDADKYDLRLFWKAFRSACTDRMKEDTDPLKYARAIAITGESLAQLNIRGINKQELFDVWLLNIREEWL